MSAMASAKKPILSRDGNRPREAEVIDASDTPVAPANVSKSVRAGRR